MDMGQNCGIIIIANFQMCSFFFNQNLELSHMGRGNQSVQTKKKDLREWKIRLML